MKRVPQPTSEPHGLAEYRSNHPNEVAAPACEGARLWECFRNSDGGAPYRELLDVFSVGQQGLCGYCEQRLTHPASHPQAGERVYGDYQIEHVQPKSGVDGAALDGANLMLACGGGTYVHSKDGTRYRASRTRGASESCGQHKGDAVLLPGCDPRTFRWRRSVVRISSDGRIEADEAACRMAAIDPAMLDSTIDEVLNLNCERLRFARQTVVDQILGEVMQTFELLIDASPDLNASEQRAILTLMAGSHLRPDSHGCLKAFWSTWRQYLGPPAEAWLVAHHALLNFGPEPPPASSAA